MPLLAAATASNPGAPSSALNSVLTPVIAVNGVLASSATRPAMSRGFVISTFVPPSLRKTSRFAVSAKT